MSAERIKVLHCADIHLGSPCKILHNKSDKRKAELKSTFLSVVKICAEENVDLLLISGDMFDSESINVDTVDEIKKNFGNIKSRVFISPGNHDPFFPGCIYDSEWPENVHIFKDWKVTNVDIPDLGIRVWGAGFNHMYESEPILEHVSVIKDNMINICVIHGLITSDKSNCYNPISIDSILKSGFDYIALGHIHKRSEVKKAGGTYYAYPGCIEGRGFDELGDKGCYFGYIYSGNCDLEYRKLCKRELHEVMIEVSECRDNSSIVNKIILELEKKYKNQYYENIYRITLNGNISENFSVEVEEIESRINDEVFFADIIDNTRIDISMQNTGHDDDLKGIFLRKMKERIDSASSGEERKILELALKLGIKAFSEEVKYR